MTTTAWTATQCRESLFATYTRLLGDLPNVLADARRLDDSQRADAVMDAIDATCAYAERPDKPDITTPAQSQKVCWSSARRTVKQQLDGRHDTLRGGFTAAELDHPDALDIAAADPTPEAALIAEHETRLVHELAATLEGDVAEAFAVMYSGAAVLGRRRLAAALNVSAARGKQLEREVHKQLDAFAELMQSTRLCRTRKLQIGDTISGRGDESTARIAKAHVAHCPSCRQDLATLKRHVHSARFGRKVAGLLPIPAAGSDRHGRVRDWLMDLLGRHGDSAAAATTQLVNTGAGRVGGTIAGCVATGLVGFTVCAATGVVSLPLGALRDARPEPAARATATPVPTVTRVIATRTPEPIVTAAPTPKPRPKPKRRRAPSSSGGSGSTRSSGGSAQENPSPPAPAPSGSLPNGQSEFGPSSATESAPPAPASSASGASEFGP